MIQNQASIARTPPREVAVSCVEAGIKAANPTSVFAEKVQVEGDCLNIESTSYDLSLYDNVYVIGGGNAAGHVAATLESLLGEVITTGTVVTDDPVDTEYVDVLEADYPVPSEQCMSGTRRVLDLAEEASEDDIVLVTLSGGGSPLLSAPVANITLSDLQSLTKELFSKGLRDREINIVRKHLSAIKGGKLAQKAMPAEVVTLLFSDVISHDQAAVASGPTLPDDSTYADALDVLVQHNIDPPNRVERHLKRGRRGSIPETPTSGTETFNRVSCHTLADGTTALKGASDFARELGYEPLILSSWFRGDAREAAKALVSVGEECYATGIPVEPPAVILANGQISADSSAYEDLGPNQIFALSASIEFRDSIGAAGALASVGTDGFDGFADYAGAVVDNMSAYPVAEAREALEQQRTSSFLGEKGDRVEMSTTGTNVNDLHILVVSEDA